MTTLHTKDVPGWEPQRRQVHYHLENHNKDQASEEQQVLILGKERKWVQATLHCSCGQPEIQTASHSVPQPTLFPARQGHQRGGLYGSHPPLEKGRAGFGYWRKEGIYISTAAPATESLLLNEVCPSVTKL